MNKDAIEETILTLNHNGAYVSPKAAQRYTSGETKTLQYRTQKHLFAFVFNVL